MKKRNREKGVALLFALGMLALLMVLGLAFVTNALLAQKVARNNSARAQARMFAMSAINRVAASIMLYQEQVYLDETAMPEDFSSIYSYGFRPGSGTAIDQDALTGSSSLMLLPTDDSVIASSLATEYNDRYFTSGGTWPGSWVYFFDGTGSGRKIVGRAAWQVLSHAPQISAPVFWRGEMEDNGPVLQNRGFVPQKNRWGREIDEVYFHNTTLLGELSNHDETNSKKNGYDGRRIKDYDAMYFFFQYVPGGLSDAQKMWLKRWFTPDPDAHDNVNACWNPTPMVPEVYEYRKTPTSGLIQMLRFNISELSPNTDFSAYCKEGTKGSSDPWYLRFGINSADSTEINSDTAINRLTQPGEPYLIGYEYDYDVPVDERGGLPFLRRVGNAPETFSDLATLRKQIAANFNDYCDADSIPTSDVPAANWSADLDDKFQEPSYTGNEKTPYLYEIGLQLGVHASDKTADAGKAGLETKAELNGTNVTLTPSAVFRLAPMVKLANLYPFTPGAQETDYQKLVRQAPQNLKARVDFSSLELTMKISKIDVEISGSWTDGNASGKISISEKDLNLAERGGNLQNLRKHPFTLKSNATKEEKSQPILLDDAEVKHDTGNSFANPYPLFTSPAEEMQKINTVSVSPEKLPAVSIDVATVNSLSPGEIPDEASITINDVDITATEVEITKFELNFDRAVLFYPRATADGIVDTGLDFVRKRTEKFTWAEGSDALKLTLNKDNSDNGIIAGLMRNYDPRQNLNNGDWQVSGGTAPLLKIAQDYKKPTIAEVCSVMAAMAKSTDKPTGCVNGDDLFSPRNMDNTLRDCETVTEPAWTSDKINSNKTDSDKSDDSHLSTAFIRNAPMMSPWEIGLIHRGAKWQTLNIKHAGAPGTSGKTVTTVGLNPAAGWTAAGTEYADGDGALLDQIKMTEQILTYGKINVNKFRYGVPGFDPVDTEKKDQNIVQALFEKLPYQGDMKNFIAGTTRNADGKFPAPETPTHRLTKENAKNIFTYFAQNKMTYPTGLSSDDEEQTSGLFATRSQFLNWEIGGHSLYDAFGKVSEQKNDVQMEEIVGRSINLLTATPSTPSQVQIVIVAQSINDTEGMQYRAAPDTAANYTVISGSVAIDSDGLASKSCANGRFDAYIHSSNDHKNIYFDEITGEVKMFVTLERDTVTGRMRIRKIDYLE